MTLFLVYHRRWIDDCFYDSKTIGVYSSYEKAMETIAQYTQIIGFSDFVNGFNILPLKTKFAKKNNGRLVSIYLLTKVKMVDQDELTVSYNICTNKIYAWCLWLLKTVCYIIQRKYRLYISKYSIDEDNWKDGFVIMK